MNFLNVFGSEDKERQEARKIVLDDVYDFCFEKLYPHINEQKMATCLDLYGQSRVLSEKAFISYLKSQKK